MAVLPQSNQLMRQPHVTGARRIVILSMLAGALITSLWSFRFVDSTIGDNVANSILGYDAKATPISGALAGALFAFVSGLAGTFTACNICAFSAIAPLATEKRPVGQVLQPLVWLGLGLVAVAACYGALGALIGPTLPQLSGARLGDPVTGYPMRLLQSSIIFVTVGILFVAWGLASLNLIHNPLARISHRFSWAPSLFMGALIGGFLVGRPFPLFRKMFEFAAATHNPLYGALTFILQALGNVALMIALFLFLVYGTGGRFERWLQSRPDRTTSFTAVVMLVGGTFLITYWGLRVPSNFGIGWWPAIQWE